MIETDDAAAFQTTFNNLVNNKTGADTDRIQFQANVTYQHADGSVGNIVLGKSSHPRVGGEHAVRVSEWVIVEKLPGCSDTYCLGKHAVLVEALLWRD